MGIPPLSSLILTDPRVLIADLLLVKAEDGQPKKLTTTEILTETNLNPSTVYINIKALANSGWFQVDWEDVDPYDFQHAQLRRRIFLREGIDGVLAACIADFTRFRPSDYGRQATRQIEYAAPTPEDIADPDNYTPVHCGAQMSKFREQVLLHLLASPDRYHYPADVGRALGGKRGSMRQRMAQCEEVGLMKSVVMRQGKVRSSVAYKLTEVGLKTAQALAAKAAVTDD